MHSRWKDGMSDSLTEKPWLCQWQWGDLLAWGKLSQLSLTNTVRLKGSPVALCMNTLWFPYQDKDPLTDSFLPPPGTFFSSAFPPRLLRWSHDIITSAHSPLVLYVLWHRQWLPTSADSALQARYSSPQPLHAQHVNWTVSKPLHCTLKTENFMVYKLYLKRLDCIKNHPYEKHN